MAEHMFQFSLKLTDPGQRTALLGDVITNMLGHIGYQEAAAAAILGHVHGAVAEAVAGGCHDCTLHVHVESGELSIVVVHDGREWRTTRPLP